MIFFFRFLFAPHAEKEKRKSIYRERERAYRVWQRREKLIHAIFVSAHLQVPGTSDCVYSPARVSQLNGVVFCFVLDSMQ